MNGEHPDKQALPTKEEQTQDECRCTCGLYPNPSCPCRYADCPCKRFWNGELVQRHPEQRA